MSLTIISGALDMSQAMPGDRMVLILPDRLHLFLKNIHNHTF